MLRPRSCSKSKLRLYFSQSPLGRSLGRRMVECRGDNQELLVGVDEQKLIPVLLFSLFVRCGTEIWPRIEIDETMGKCRHERAMPA